MTLSERAGRHAALGDERRLLIVDQLSVGDRSAAELADLVSMPGNLLAHHLDVLEDAGLIERRVSEGDHRRKYVSLRWEALPRPVDHPSLLIGRVAFVCTHNSARSQFAAALWQRLTGAPASSAGTEPAKEVNFRAVQVASEFGVDISRAKPSAYESLPTDLDVLICVCDRANEAIVPDVPRLHWSIPDPIPVGTLKAFRSAFADIANRMRHVVGEAL